jgi:HEAT repeat protein
MSMRRVARSLLLGTLSGAALVSAQAPARLPGAMSVDEATLLTNAYAHLAQGDRHRAHDKAVEGRTRFPRSSAVLAMAIDVDIAWGGAKSGLDVYEAWLGARTLEEPSLLRTIAIASLREFAAQTKDGMARDGALWALVDEGDANAYQEVLKAAQQEETGAVRGLAARGHKGAVAALLNVMKMRTPNAMEVIRSLGESGDPSVIEPLALKLKDPEPGIRAAAVEALAKVGGPSAIPRIRPLLTDPADRTGYVRSSVAAALLRLNDYSGIKILRDLAESELPAGRLRAAELMASHPDEAWLRLVRSLLDVPDGPQDSAERDNSVIRLGAATLLAAHDRQAAGAALERLSSHSNAAIRDEAFRHMASDLNAPLPTLRGLLRHSDWLTRVHAATSIARLTR